MPISESIRKVALELERQKGENLNNPTQSLNVYQINQTNNQEQLTDRQKFDLQRKKQQEELKSLQESSSPSQTNPDQNLGVLKNLGQSLYKGAAAGLYEYGESFAIGVPGLAEASLKRFGDVDLGIQETVREYQEEDLFAKVAGGVGMGAGYLTGLPVKGTSLALGKLATFGAAKLFGKETVGSAVSKITKSAIIKGGKPLSKKAQKEVTEKFSNVLSKTMQSTGLKTAKASKTFEKSFATNINARIIQLQKSGQINSAQVDAMRKMANVVANKGVPVHTLQSLAKAKFGTGMKGRFMGEFLEDAFVFSVADGAMSITQQGQRILRDEQDSINFGFGMGGVMREVAFGFAAGTAVNVGASAFKPVGKMLKSKVDFGQGVRSILGKNTYKDKSLTYLTGQLTHMAEQNKYNLRSTRLNFTKDGEKNYIDLMKFNKGNEKLTKKSLEKELRREFGDDAEKKAIDWLMSERKQYGKDIIRESVKEGFENYKVLFPRMMVTGGIMSGTQGFQNYIEAGDQFEFDPTDYISNFVIGGFTMRRGNFGKVDIDTKIQKLREGLDALGVESSNTFFASSLSGGNERFGVGLLRDNPELAKLLEDERIVSDEDDSITNDSMAENERTFLDLDSGQPIDPYGGRMNILKGLMDEDYNHVKTLNQITDKQASKIIKLLDSQGLKTAEDFDKALQDRVGEATSGMEESLVSVLKDLNSANLDDPNFSIKENNQGITIPANLKISNELLERARNGEFSEWLSDKKGSEAEEELLDAVRSIETVIAVTEGLGRTSFDTSQSVNKIDNASNLKTIYDIIRKSENSIDESVSNKDGRSSFKFTELESYIIPMMRNMGNNNTKKIMSVLSEKNMDSKLLTLFENAGILVKKTGEPYKIINDYSSIKTSDDASKVDLGKIHGILKALGEFEITETPNNQQVEISNVNSLKGQLGSLGVKVDLLNKKNLEFMYQLVLNDINKIRLKNSVIDPSDVDFIIQQSGDPNLSIPGVLDDKGIRNFQLKKVSIPSNLELENRYNTILSNLKKTKVVNIVSDVVRLNPEDANVLEKKINIIYSTDRSSDNIKIETLFEMMSNRKLTTIKQQMQEHILQFGDQARIDILNMLKQQNIIERNVDGDLNIIEDNLTIERFETIKQFVNRKGMPSELVQQRIDERKEINRKYIKDSSDVIKNPSLSIDQFFSKYKLKQTLDDGSINYVSHADSDNIDKKNLFDNLIFEDSDEGRVINKNSIQRIADQIATKENVDFNNLKLEQKEKVLADINQIAFGSKDRISVRKMSIRNNELSIDDNKELMQRNPVHSYFESLDLNYGIFDNTIVYTEFNQNGNLVEKTYNILQTQNIPLSLVNQIQKIRDRVSSSLNSKSLNPSDPISPEPNDIGIKKLDVYDGMDSIIINTRDQQKIVDDFYRFHKEHVDKVDKKTRDVLNKLKKSFDNAEDIYKYKEDKVELATRFLVFEVAFKSKENDVFYKVLNETNPEQVDKYVKRIKLVTTKNFVRPTKSYLESIKQARKQLLGKEDKVVKLINKRIRKKGHNVVVWDDDSSESMSQLINDLKEEFPEFKDYNLNNIIGTAHSKVSAFDSISYLSRDAMMEYHSYLGHDTNSTNPIKPVISSQGEGKTLLYGKTLFVYSPALDGFFKNNPTVDILLTKSGAKAYDEKDGEESVIKNVRFDDLNKESYSSLIKTIDIDALGLRPEKDASLLSASVSDADYNYMNLDEHSKAFSEVEGELDANLKTMKDIMSDPYRMNAFMRSKMEEGKIPQDSQEGSLQNLSNLMYYLHLKDSADPTDYSINQVQKYLAKEYIDTIFSNRRAITNRVYDEDPGESFRYGGQAPLVVSGKSHLGEGKKTRLLPTLFNDQNKMILRGQLMLPHKEKDTKLSQLGTKEIRIVQNEKVLTLSEFINEAKASTEISKESIDVLDAFEDQIKSDGTLGSAHEMINTISEETGTRYEVGVISRRNPRTRPNDITLLGLKGFLEESQGLGVEINSFDVANVYEGDYDADKVDYFFAHDDYMFDYIKRNQAYYVQGIDPSELQNSPTFTFQMEASDSRSSILSKIGSSISYKQGIGIVQKTPRKINYLQNLGSNEYLFDDAQSEAWEDEIRINPETNEKIGPSLLYKSGDNQFVTVDTQTLAYYQRAGLEIQYILDGSGKINKNIASDIYNWADKFLFPKNSESISPKKATSTDINEIIKNGQTPDGKRVRIFQKFTLDEASGKYKTSTELNNADKLIIKEFLNQQNKLLNAFGDQTYTEGSPRKSTFYDLYNGSRIFRDFHKDVYKGLERQLFYKKKPLSSKDKKYLKGLLNPESGSFEPIESNIKEIYDGEGGGYLDRMAVAIAKSEFMEDKKQSNLDIETYVEVDNWFNNMLNTPSDDDGNFESINKKESEEFILDVEEKIIDSSIDKISKGIVKDTKEFNSYIATIKRLSNKKKFIEKSSYGWRWKKHKIDGLNFVINKMQENVQNKYKQNIKNINPFDLKYKKYIPIEDSNLVKSIIHSNSLHAFLKKKHFSDYDSWTETLGVDTDARKDLQSIKDFNAKVLGGNTLIDDIIPNGKRTIIADNRMFDYIQQHKTDISNVWELRQKFLLNKINKHGINFLYAYMEPTRDKTSIGVFNNRAIAIPYKESKRYSHGIQLLTSMAQGNEKLFDSFKGVMVKDYQKESEGHLIDILNANEHYRKFFTKDVELMDLTDPSYDNYPLMGFDKNTENRLNTNMDFSWSAKMLSSDPLSTINKSTIEVYRDFVEVYTDKTNEDFIEFATKLNDIDEYSARTDYVNPLRYMEKRLSLDELFRKLSKDNVYDVIGQDGKPSNMLENDKYLNNKFFKFKPKLVKTNQKLISMMKGMREMKNELNRSVRENPAGDSGHETIRTIKEIADCL